jgi:hypothetical protein
LYKFSNKQKKKEGNLKWMGCILKEKIMEFHSTFGVFGVFGSFHRAVRLQDCIIVVIAVNCAIGVRGRRVVGHVLESILGERKPLFENRNGLEKKTRYYF